MDRNFRRLALCSSGVVALLAEGVDRNDVCLELFDGGPESPSSRRAWIEIFYCVLLPQLRQVALLAEGVDRNFRRLALCSSGVVALLAEGVDRNDVCLELFDGGPESPSSRRAWIEIFYCVLLPQLRQVALLAEGVDRNGYVAHIKSTQSCRPPRGGRG